MKTVYTDTRAGEPTQPPAPAPRNQRTPQDQVPRQIGWIEPWIGGSVSVYTAWIAMSAHAEQAILWLYVVLTAGLAWWGWRRPARRQSELLARGVIFAALGFLVLFQGRLDPLGAGGYLFYWLTAPMVLYAFLLRPSLAWVLLAANVAAFLLSVVAGGTAAPPKDVLMHGGFMFIFCVAAIRMGMMLRRTDELLEVRRVDAASGMFNEYGFLDHGAELWAYCRKTGIPVTLVFLDIPDLHRLRELYGTSTARTATSLVIENIAELDVGRSVLARLSLSRFALLLPDATRAEAMAFVSERLGRTPKIEIDEAGLEMIFLVDVHSAESRLHGVSFSRFYEAELSALDAMADGRTVKVVPVSSGNSGPQLDDPDPGALPDVQLPTTVPLGLSP